MYQLNLDAKHYSFTHIRIFGVDLLKATLLWAWRFEEVILISELLPIHKLTLDDALLQRRLCSDDGLHGPHQLREKFTVAVQDLGARARLPRSVHQACL